MYILITPDKFLLNHHMTMNNHLVYSSKNRNFKNMKLKNLIYAFIFLFIAASCSESVIEPAQDQPGTTDLKAGVIGTTYYVATTGSDSNSGTTTSPFLTIQKASTVVNPGDVVIVRDGVYSNSVPNYGSEQAIVKMTRSGNSTGWITFKAENKGKAVLDGLNNAAEFGFMVEGLSYIKIEGFEVKNVNLWGIDASVGSHHLEFRNNYIHHIGRIIATTTNGFCAFNLTGVDNILVEGNLVHDVGRLSPNEGGSGSQNYLWNDHGIYINGVNNCIIKDNIFYNVFHGWALHFYSGSNNPSSNISVLNNTFAFNKTAAGLIVLYAALTNVNIQNNLFYISADANLEGISPSSNVGITINADYPYAGVTINHNMMYRGNGIIAKATSGVTIDNNIVNTDPQITNPAAFDFRLLSTSPAINAGVNVGLTIDYLGNGIVGLPDIGAYEYGSAVVAPVVVAPVVTAPVVTAPVATAPVATIYYNIPITGSATKNDCGTGYTGSLVTVTMPAQYVSSTISQADADNKASALMKTNIQAYANANGTCTRKSYWWRR